MKIIYHCYGGAHSSVTAANIHLERLPRNRTVALEEIKNQKFFDLNGVKDSGKIFFMGRDSIGNDVYIVGRRSRPKIFYQVIEKLSESFAINSKSYILIDVSPHVNLTMKIGGFISRRMGLIAIGRPIVTWGTRRSYGKILSLVENIKSQLEEKSFPTTRNPFYSRRLSVENFDFL